MNAPLSPLATRHHSASIEILRTLIAFDTTSRNSNLPLIHWVRDYLQAHGIASKLVFDATGQKANLFATVGSGKEAGMIFSGHTDTVPVDGQPWTSNPYELIERGDKLYARGSADMKGFIACALAQVPAYLAQPHDRPFHLALSYDEEVGCRGVWSLAEEIRASGASVAGCIVGEPSSMQPIVAHKGTHRFRCCVTGQEAHSALPHLGVNAIHAAHRLMTFLLNEGDAIAARETPDAAFEFPTSTLSLTMIDGGTGQNIVPRNCNVQVDVRTVPGTEIEPLLAKVRDYAQSLEPAMQAVTADAGIEIQFQSSSPGFGIESDAPLLRYVEEKAQSTRRIKVGFGTEAGIFTKYNIPTIIIGPGDIAQAHQADEFVAVEQLAQCDQFLARVLAEPFIEPAA